MSKKKWLLAGLVIFLIVLVIAKLLKAAITLALILGAVVGSIVLGALLALWIERLFREEKAKAPSKQEPQQQGDSLLEKALRALSELNLKLRLGPDLAEIVLSKSEALIDRLGEMLPRLNEEYKNSELTFVANRIASEYLPDLVGAYLQLSTEDRTGKTNDLTQTLAGLDSEVAKIVRLIDSQRLNEFDKEAMFLRHKFFGETIEA